MAASSTSFKKGTSGNPGGWPRGLEKYMRDELKKLRISVADLQGIESEVDGYQALFRRLMQIAMTGEDKTAVVAIKLMFERTYGMPKQKIALDDQPDDEDDSELDGLSIDELRILAKVRTASVTAPASSDDVH